ncbi:MAG TPA: hypothetical protein PLP75_08755 [Burkholderiales bacterium]|nr:hypothetical protein [Burkholderiales bacterium]
MKLSSIWRLFNTSQLSITHKKSVILALVILSLEYFDIIVYLHNASALTKLYCHSPIRGILVLFGVLWFSNFLAKYLVGSLIIRLYRRFSSSTIMVLASITIACMLALQAMTIAYFCQSLVQEILLALLIFRFVYQICIGIIIHETYESVLSMQQLSFEFSSIIIGSLELSLLAGVIGYKVIDYLHLSPVNSLLVFIYFLGVVWLGVALFFCFFNYELSNQGRNKFYRYMASNNFKLMFKHFHQDTLIAITLVGVRSSLCIISVIYMPKFLEVVLGISLHTTSNIIMSSSIVAIILCWWVNKHLNRFNYANLIKVGLVSLIMGSIISYILFFFKFIPLVGVLILVVFHNLFALSCPLILSNLFTPTIRQLAIISCYRNSFLAFASLTYLVMEASSQTVHNNFFPPAIFLIVIALVCYGCLVLFNRKTVLD